VASSASGARGIKLHENYLREKRHEIIQICLERQPHKVAVRLRVALKWTAKWNCCKWRGHVFRFPIDGDANAQFCQTLTDFKTLQPAESAVNFDGSRAKHPSTPQTLCCTTLENSCLCSKFVKLQNCGKRKNCHARHSHSKQLLKILVQWRKHHLVHRQKKDTVTASRNPQNGRTVCSCDDREERRRDRASTQTIYVHQSSSQE